MSSISSRSAFRPPARPRSTWSLRHELTLIVLIKLVALGMLWVLTRNT